MNNFNRRSFLKAGSLLMAAPFVPKIFSMTKNKPLLSFSTLGCPDWNFKQITDFAIQHNYQGIELRGLLRQMDLPKCPEFNTAKNIAETISIMKDKILPLLILVLLLICTLLMPLKD